MTNAVSKDTFFQSLVRLYEGAFLEVVTNNFFRSDYYKPDQFLEVYERYCALQDVYIGIGARVQARADCSRSGAKDVAFLKHFLIDIDDHDLDRYISEDEAQSAVNWFFTHFSFLKEHVHYIAISGRGVHIDFLFAEPVKPGQYNVFAHIMKAFIEKVNKTQKKGWKIDKAVLDVARIIRMPFSMRSNDFVVNVIYFNPDCQGLVIDDFISEHIHLYNKGGRPRSGDPKEANKIREIARFSDFLGVPEKSSYKYDVYLCPFHNETHASFVVYKNANGEVAVDFHDGKKYDVIAYVMAKENKSYHEAVREIKSKYREHFPENNIAIIDGIQAYYIEDYDYYVYAKNGRYGVIKDNKKFDVCSEFYIVEDGAGCKYLWVVEGNGRRIHPISAVNIRNIKEYLDIYYDGNYYLGGIVNHVLNNVPIKKVVNVNLGYNHDLDDYFSPLNAERFGPYLLRSSNVFWQYVEPKIDERYRHFVHSALKEGKYAGVLFAFAFAAAIGVRCIVFIRGRAHTGKTTFARLGSRLYSDYSFSAKSFSFPALENFRKAFVNCVLFIDEYDQKFKNLDDLIFSISSETKSHSDTKMNVHFYKTSNIAFLTTEAQGFASRTGAERRSFVLELRDQKEWGDYTPEFLVEMMEYKGLALEFADFVYKNKLHKHEEVTSIIKHSKLEYWQGILRTIRLLEMFFNDDFSALRAKVNEMIEAYYNETFGESDLTSVLKDFSHFLTKHLNQFYRRDEGKTWKPDGPFYGWLEYYDVTEDQVKDFIQYFTEKIMSMGYLSETKVLALINDLLEDEKFLEGTKCFQKKYKEVLQAKLVKYKLQKDAKMVAIYKQKEAQVHTEEIAWCYLTQEGMKAFLEFCPRVTQKLFVAFLYNHKIAKYDRFKNFWCKYISSTKYAFFIDIQKLNEEMAKIESEEAKKNGGNEDEVKNEDNDVDEDIPF